MRLVALGFAVLVATSASAALGAAPRDRTLTICHRTGSKQHPYVLARVPVSSVRERLRRGDVMPANGRCP
jgi:hypothetical protein